MKDKDTILLENLYIEAISLKNAAKKNLTKKGSKAYTIDKINSVFNGKDRLVYDIDVFDSSLINKDFPILEKLLEFLKKDYPEYIIPDKKSYIEGLAYKKDDKDRTRAIRIGKLLNKIANRDESVKDLFKAFNEDPLRSASKNKKLKVVISRHPYDIAGMSTDRAWTSCMNLGYKGINYDTKGDGINKRFVQQDIDAGTLIAYLVSDSDRHPNGKLAIKTPLARILLKPYINEKNKNDYAYSVETLYGANNPVFYDFVKKWVNKTINNDVDGKTYILAPNLYWDGTPYTNFKAVRSSHKEYNEMFFSELGYRTSEKFFRNFSLNVDDDMYNHTNVEIRIEFSLPPDVKLNKIRYDSNDAKPKYVESLIKELGFNPSKKRIGWAYGYHNGVTLVETFPENENLLVVEVTIKLSSNYNTYEEPKYYTVEDDLEQKYDNFQQSLKELHFDDFNYAEKYKIASAIMKTANPESEEKEEYDEIKNEFQTVLNAKPPNVSGKLQQYLAEYNKLKPQYDNAISSFNINRLGYKEFFNLINSAEYKKNIQVIDKTKSVMYKIHDYFESYRPRRDYPHVSVNNIWSNLITELLGNNTLHQLRNLREISPKPWNDKEGYENFYKNLTKEQQDYIDHHINLLHSIIFTKSVLE